MLTALDAGADDIFTQGDARRITSDPSEVYDVKAKLEEAGVGIVSADSPMVAENLIEVTDLKDARAILRIMEALEDNDDVQDVFSNFDISDELMEEAGRPNEHLCRGSSAGLHAAWDRRVDVLAGGFCRQAGCAGFLSR